MWGQTDANSDGIVDNTDVFEIGLAFNNTGTARSPGGNNYVSQYATNWTGSVSTGKNKAHADCNGDGTINNGDTLAIFNNFNLTHSFKPAAGTGTNDISIVAPNVAYLGQWNKADVMLGDATNQMSQLYGVAFDVVFDESLMDDAYLKFVPSFLNASNQNVEFKKPDMVNGKIYSASVRTDGTNINGDGKIGEFYFKLKSNLPPNTVVNLSVINPKRIGNNGVKAPLTGLGSTANVSNNLVGLNNITATGSVHVFPNPANQQLSLFTDAAGTYSLIDLTGRVLIEGSVVHHTELDLSIISNGNYILKFEAAGKVEYKKIAVIR